MKTLGVCLGLGVCHVVAAVALFRRPDHFFWGVDVMWGVAFVLSSIVACEGWVWLSLRPVDLVFWPCVVSYGLWIVAYGLVWRRLALVCGLICTCCVGVLCWEAVEIAGWEQSFPALWLWVHVVTWDLFFWRLSLFRAN